MAELEAENQSVPDENQKTVVSSGKPPSPQPPLPKWAIAKELSGEMLDHYRIDRYVAVGGMGAVFRATDTRLDRPVALKILPPAQAKDAEIVTRFHQEARAAARLDHENIARVFLVGEDRGLHFIAFEYIEGVNVRDLIEQRGTLPPVEVVNYAVQIAGALVHAAARGVVHRDIKPSNLIITASGRAKLVDMGLARRFERRYDGGLTQSGVTMGTFDYISPEQARDPRTADCRSDIYSLGCTLYHMLTGRPPYPDGTVLQKLLMHQAESAPDPRQAHPPVPDKLAELVKRMMAKDPVDRHQTPEELLGELLEIAAAMGLRSTSPEGLIWVTDSPRSHAAWTPWAVWLGALAALVLVVAALYLRPDRVASTPRTASLQQERAQPEATEGQPESQPPSEASAPDAAALPPASEVAEPASLATGSDLGPAPLFPASDTIPVSRAEDFQIALEQATPGSTIEIQGMVQIAVGSGFRIEGKRLTIRGVGQPRPRFKLTIHDQAATETEQSMFSLLNSAVQFEGIEFEVEAADAQAPLTMLRVESSDLTLRNCRFLESGVEGSATRPVVWVAHVHENLLDLGAEPAKIEAMQCDFEGGFGAFSIAAPVRLKLQECTLLPYRVTFVLNESLDQSPMQITLANVSLFGNGKPFFQLRSANAVVNSEAVVFAFSPLIDRDPFSQLVWQASGNRYHRVYGYEVVHSDMVELSMVTSLSAWTTTQGVRDDGKEVDSLLQPVREGSVGDPRRLYALRLSDILMKNRPGVGSGPVQPSMATPRATRAPDATNRIQEPALPAQSPATDPSEERTTERLLTRNPPSSTKAAGSDVPPSPSPGQVEVESGVGQPDAASPMTGEDVLVVNPDDLAAYASLADACREAQDGSIIEIQFSRTLSEPPIELGDQHLIIRAAAGYRPIIRLEVNDQLDLEGQPPRLFSIRSGSLTLRDLDFLIVPNRAVSPDSTWSLVSSRAADVEMEHCTVRVEAQGTKTTLVHFLAGLPGSDMMDPMAAGRTSRPHLQLSNSLVVGPSSLIRVQPAGAIRVDVENCAMEVQDNFLESVGGTEELEPELLNQLDIRHSTVKVRRSLLSYEINDYNRPWLPQLEIRASDNIFVSLGLEDYPWVYFDSPAPVDDLRGLLHWMGRNNRYAGMETFWQIYSMGTSTDSDLASYDWEAWRSAADRRYEVNARYDEALNTLYFVLQADGTVPIWQRRTDHFRLMEDASVGRERGVDITQLPLSAQKPVRD